MFENPGTHCVPFFENRSVSFFICPGHPWSTSQVTPWLVGGGGLVQQWYVPGASVCPLAANCSAMLRVLSPRLPPLPPPSLSPLVWSGRASAPRRQPHVCCSIVPRPPPRTSGPGCTSVGCRPPRGGGGQGNWPKVSSRHSGAKGAGRLKTGLFSEESSWASAEIRSGG